MQRSIKEYHPGQELVPIKTVTCILLYIGHSDVHLTSCQCTCNHNFYQKFQSHLPLVTNNVQSHNFLCGHKVHVVNGIVKIVSVKSIYNHIGISQKLRLSCLRNKQTRWLVRSSNNDQDLEILEARRKGVGDDISSSNIYFEIIVLTHVSDRYWQVKANPLSQLNFS